MIAMTDARCGRVASEEEVVRISGRFNSNTEVSITKFVYGSCISSRSAGLSGKRTRASRNYRGKKRSGRERKNCLFFAALKYQRLLLENLQ